MMKDAWGEEWLTPKEAATRLGLSVSRIYQLKEQLTHKKQGREKQGRVFFLARTLFEDYMSL